MQSPESSIGGSVIDGAPSRACQNCARAKTKCVTAPDQQKCARCLRLKRECIVVPKSSRKKRSPNIKTTAQLEEKIESLVTLLSATHTAANLNTERRPGPETIAQRSQQEGVKKPDDIPAICWNPEIPLNTSRDSTSWNTTHRQHTTVSAYSIPTPASTILEPISISAPSIDIQIDNPDRLLNIYREYHAVDFPFVIIPSDINAQQLQARRPWVAITISMLASYENRNQQLALAKQIIMEFAKALLIRSEKSLDLLESMILFSLWQYYYAFGSPQNQSSAILQLALALLYDLGLNKPLREIDGPGMIPDSAELMPDATKEIRRTSQERRAHLSMFIMTSISSCVMKKIDGLEHRPYLDYSCQLLLEAAESPSDYILVFMARAQALVQTMSRSLQHSLVPGSLELKAPLSMQAKSAKADLQNYLLALPPDIQEHSLVRRAYHSAEVFFYESSLYRSFFPSSQNSQRLDMLWACTMAIRSNFDYFLSMPIPTYNSMSIITLNQNGHSMSTAFKLCFIEAPGWDLAQVRATLDLLEYFNQSIDRFARVGAQTDISQAVPTRRSFCTGGALVMGRIKAAYEARLAAEAEKRQQDERNGQAAMDGDFAGEVFGYFDDPYLMSDWNWEEMMDNFMQE